MKIRYRQIIKWIDIVYANYYKYGLKRYLKASKTLKRKQIINALYGMKVQKMVHDGKIR